MNRTEKLNFLINKIKKMHPTTTEIDEDTVLREIGLDSLDIVELQLYYEEETNEEIPDPEFPIVTVKDLINVICQ